MLLSLNRSLFSLIYWNNSAELLYQMHHLWSRDSQFGAFYAIKLKISLISDYFLIVNIPTWITVLTRFNHKCFFVGYGWN